MPLRYSTRGMREVKCNCHIRAKTLKPLEFFPQPLRRVSLFKLQPLWGSL